MLLSQVVTVLYHAKPMITQETSLCQYLYNVVNYSPTYGSKLDVTKPNVYTKDAGFIVASASRLYSGGGSVVFLLESIETIVRIFAGGRKNILP